jgi:deoxyribonuclease-4
MFVRFGPAGIPLSCKGRTLKDGLEDIYALELNAMEIQLVRGVGQMVENATEIAALAEELDIQISVHTPYYMDLLGDEEGIERSLENIKWSAMLANELGSAVINTHIGLYGNRTEKDAVEVVVKNVRYIRNWFKKENIKVKLGLETSGKQKVFGSLDEVLNVCKRVSGTVPVLNFAHIHAYENGILKKKNNFQEIFDKTEKALKTKTFYTHFSGIEHEDGNKKRCTPIKKGDMRFDPLADCILDNEDYELTIISGSPLLEHDAMYMKVILDRVQQKREAKAKKAKEEKN